MSKAIFSLLCFLSLVALADKREIEKESVEINLEKAFTAISIGEMQKARSILLDTLEHYPNFHLARMVYADLIATQAQHSPLLANPAAQSKARISGLAEEAVARLVQKTPKSNELPVNIVRLSQNHQHVLCLMPNTRVYMYSKTTKAHLI